LKPDQWLAFNALFPGKTFKNFISEFINTISASTFVSETGERILYLHEQIALSTTYYGAVVRRGLNGQETYIDEVNSSKARTVGTISHDQYTSSPFYVGIYQSDINSKRIILMVQSYKQYGFKELFEEAFKVFFKTAAANNFICEINSLAIGKLFDKYINDGNIRKLRFKKHALPKNMENLLSGNDDKHNKSYEVELSVKAKKQGFGGIKKFIKNAEFIEVFDDQDFEYDELLADISIGNRKRVVNIMDPSSFTASYDITDNAPISSQTGLPDFKAIHKEAKIILEEEILLNIDSE
jgi:hypothetical protein